MFDRILQRARERIAMDEFLLTLHAEEEMENDGFSIYDVEKGILNGEILGRQRDIARKSWKYRIRGRALDGRPIESVVSFGLTGRLAVVTVYMPS